jgi:hypothetical protein
VTTSTWRPVRTVGVYTRKSGDSIVLEGYIDVYETNQTGGLIWSLCASDLTAEQIVEQVAEQYGITPEEAEPSTTRFLHELREFGFLQEPV